MQVFHGLAHRLTVSFAMLLVVGVLSIPQAAEAVCGDGVIDCSENCDDSNAVAGDGCNQYCRIEYGYSCPTITDPLSLAPVARWRLDESAGTVVSEDILGNDGTYSGAVPGSPGAVTGRTQNAAWFDGVDDYAEMPHDPAYLVEQGTVVLWFNADSLPGASDPGAALFSKDAFLLTEGGHLSIYLTDTALRAKLQVAQQGKSHDGEACTVDSDCSGNICSTGTCAGANHFATGPLPTADAWHQVAVTFGPGGLRLYLDGVEVASNAYTGGMGVSSGGTGNTEPIALGASARLSGDGVVTPLTDFFQGRIDDVFLYDVQLDAAQVSSIYGASSCSETGGACTAGAPPGCGDGVLDEFTEQCDDNNLTPGDGCDDLCMVEFCGDGILSVGEGCDDGGARSLDGCDDNCAVEPGYACTGSPSVCTPQWNCGNAMVEPGEVCDGAGCSPDCQFTTGCGNGRLDAGEACDDYNVDAGDGCDASCAVEPGFTCTIDPGTPHDLPSNCKPTCGDGITAGWEQCDDNNTVDGDGCDAHCQIEACGDGRRLAGEACDDGNAVGGDGCSATCTVEAGFVCPSTKGGACVPETMCDPNAYKFETEKPYGHSHQFSCPWHETLDANVDGVLDCADRTIISVYKKLPAFDIIAGETTIAFDALSISPTEIRAEIAFAPATSDGSAQPASAFVTVVTAGGAGFGDTTLRNFDLVFTADASFSFAGGGLIMRVKPLGGTATTFHHHGGTRQVETYVDTDGEYPWDATYESYSDSMPVIIERGVPVCEDLKYGKCDPSGPYCRPFGQDFPQSTVWCGNDGATGQNCNELDYFSWSSGSSYNSGTQTGCVTRYLYRRDFDCITQGPGLGSCSIISSDTQETYSDFCESCDDGDACTSANFNSNGCYYYEVPPTSCWDGAPGNRYVGACSDGFDYCRNPGTECIGASYGTPELCDAIDNDCNSIVDDPAETDPLCDDANASTTDTCDFGTCNNVVNCTGSDTSCGTVGPCQDCTASSGWAFTGTRVPCCDSGNSCMCDEYELRTYYCSTGTCDYFVEPVSPDYRVDAPSCATCNDANICTNDSCNVASGLCENVDSGYSAACYTGPMGTEGVGICSGGTESCSMGVLQACTDTTPTGETCDNSDEDCNGIVDDGTADAACPMGQGCWSGACDDECTIGADCAAGELCYFENTISPGRCAPDTGACDDVTCPMGATCYEGTCSNTNCGNDLDCDVYSRCYQSGRCLNGKDKRCNGVQCPQGEACVKGTCAKGCGNNTDCDPGSKCYDGACFPEVDPCAGVDCQVDEVCWQGGCFEQCMTNTDCSDPGDACYDAFRCAPDVDPCFDVTCAQGEICYQGSCFLDCSMTVCPDPADGCYEASRCGTDNCEGVQCPFGETCQGGVCYLVCTDDAICQANDPGDLCYGGVCKQDPCTDVQCLAGEVCQGGVCYLTCAGDLDCQALDPSHLCYGGFCTDDPCLGVLCPTPGEICYGGSCYPYCDGAGTCSDPLDTCYDVDVCAVDYTDLCSGVSCPTNQVCYAGSCYYDCTGNDDCTAFDPGHLCYDGRCAADACDGVSCPAGEICSQGTCYQYCDGATSCSDPSHICYNNTCRPEPLDLCADVVCAVGEACHMGVCYQTCNGTVDCSDPGHVCYDNRCVDPCEGNSCLATESCYLGACYETCDGVDPCSNPNDVCYDNRCVDAADPWCDGVTCPMAEACYRGTCYPECSDQADCDALSFDSICYQNKCLPTDCSGTICDSGETCYNGACYEDCSGGTQCSDPNMACYDNRCAASACEAQAVTFLTKYDADHVFRRYKTRLFGFQYSTPWTWPRPYESTGDNFAAWAQISAGSNSSSNNDALYSKGAARLVLYFDDTNDRYILYLIQGSKNAAQGAAEANYGVRVKSVDPKLIAMDDPGAEGYYEANTSDSWTYVQVNVKTGPGETGGVAIGEFNPDSTSWRIEINGHFSGDIDRWELMNGESGEPITTLKMGEPFSIRNVDLLAGETLQPDFGVTQCQTDKQGICKPGTTLDCQNWALTCDQSVFPWGFEICDGLDNTCNGLVDTADTSLKFAMVESRQYTNAPWKPWPTVDQQSDVDAYMNYTPSGTDDRVGSSNVLRQNGNPLQAADKIVMAMHRDVRSGQFSMPILVGARSSDEDDVEDFGNSIHRLGVGTPPGERINELFVCWYDDRKPGPTSDRIPHTYNNTDDWMAFEWETTDNNDVLESDAAVIRPVWLEGAAGGPGGVEFAVRYGDANSDDARRRWFRHAPYVADLALSRYALFWVRVAAQDPDKAFCISNTTTPAGCPLGVYSCTPEGIKCSPPDDGYCAANCGDLDGDGHIVRDPAFCPNGTDCDDFDPESHDGAVELCNGRDNDCDGFIDYQSKTICSNGNAECGPEDCGGNFVCSCPDGEREEPGDNVDKCVCGEALSP